MIVQEKERDTLRVSLYTGTEGLPNYYTERNRLLYTSHTTLGRSISVLVGGNGVRGKGDGNTVHLEVYYRRDSGAYDLIPTTGVHRLSVGYVLLVNRVCSLFEHNNTR